MGGVEIDLTKWPLAYFLVDGEQSPEDIQALIDGIDEINRRDGKFIILTEIRKFSHRYDDVRRIAEAAKKNSEFTKLNCIACALVIESEIFRLFLSTFHLIAPTPYPFETFKGSEAARTWLRERAAEANMPEVV